MFLEMRLALGREERQAPVFCAPSDCVLRLRQMNLHTDKMPVDMQWLLSYDVRIFERTSAIPFSHIRDHSYNVGLQRSPHGVNV